MLYDYGFGGLPTSETISQANHLLCAPPTNGTPLKAIINLKHITEPNITSERLEATMGRGIRLKHLGVMEKVSRNKRAPSNCKDIDSELGVRHNAGHAAVILKA
jgi:hypothetical protein